MKHFFRNIVARTYFPNDLKVFGTGNIMSGVQDANYGYATRQGILNENPSMRAVAKILRARASEHSSNFCEQFERRQNFASTFKLNGTIRYP